MKRYLEEIPELEYVLLAIDHTPWARPDAKTLKDRGYQHSAKKSQNASVIGQGYSTIAVDSGFQGVQKEYDNVRLPHKKPKGGELTEKQKEENKLKCT